MSSLPIKQPVPQWYRLLYVVSGNRITLIGIHSLWCHLHTVPLLPVSTVTFPGAIFRSVLLTAKKRLLSPFPLKYHFSTEHASSIMSIPSIINVSRFIPRAAPYRDLPGLAYRLPRQKRGPLPEQFPLLLQAPSGEPLKQTVSGKAAPGCSRSVS